MVEYVTIRLSKEIGDLIDETIEKSPLKFRSRADVVTMAVREYYQKEIQEKKPK